MKLIGFLIAIIVLLSPAYASSVISDFEDGTMQGWTATGDVAGVANPGSGGNPGGYLRMVDQAVGGICWIVAPSRYLGSWHGRSSLSADLTQISYSGSDYQNVQFVISGPGGVYRKDFGERPPLGAWRTYAVLLEESFWTRTSGSWSALMDNVTELKITMEFITGDETNGLDNVVLTESYTPTTIGLAKLLADGTDVVVDGVVTLVTNQFMYIQAENRSAGMRVRNSFSLQPGNHIRIAGQMATENNERYLNYGLVYSSTIGTEPNPLFVVNREVGGIGASVLDPALGDSKSLKETGLLIKTVGRVKTINADGKFAICDGSSAALKVALAPICAKPVWDSYVSVIGVSSNDGGAIPGPCILGVSDVQFAQVPLGANLIRNPGAEEGDGGTGNVVRPIPGWTPTSNLTVLNYGLDIPNGESTRIGGGRSYFWGGPNNALSEAYQDIGIGALAADVDVGSISVSLSGYMAGWATQGDNMIVTATFYSATGTSLGSIKIGPQAGSNQTWIFHETSGALPVGTRRIEIRMKSTRTEGAANSGYADNLSLVLTKS